LRDINLRLAEHGKESTECTAAGPAG
jgi:hypothetical protein